MVFLILKFIDLFGLSSCMKNPCDDCIDFEEHRFWRVIRRVMIHELHSISVSSQYPSVVMVSSLSANCLSSMSNLIGHLLSLNGLIILGIGKEERLHGDPDSWHWQADHLLNVFWGCKAFLSTQNVVEAAVRFGNPFQEELRITRNTQQRESRRLWRKKLLHEIAPLLHDKEQLGIDQYGQNRNSLIRVCIG